MAKDKKTAEPVAPKPIFFEYPVEEGETENPTLTLTSDGEFFRDVLLGKEDGMKGFMMGKIKLAGDLNLAMKLTSFFKMN